MADIQAELAARTGFGRLRATQEYEAAWQRVAGEAIAAQTRVGSLRRGVLEIVVASSPLLQELTFRKAALCAALAAALPEQRIEALRFRVGRVA
jgi:predicted nucleic acid-binding Zn ribbon protein